MKFPNTIGNSPDLRGLRILYALSPLYLTGLLIADIYLERLLLAAEC
jgi:hypothetical protein